MPDELKESDESDLQQHLFERPPAALEKPCATRLWLRCAACGEIEARTLSCSQPCTQCPWGPMRVQGACGRLPQVPMRHWVLVPPTRWARVLPGDRAAALAFRRATARLVVGVIERRARSELGHGRGRAGALAVMHGEGADLRPHAHVHVIATDGVFVPAAQGAATFVPLVRPLESRELREVARCISAQARAAVPDPAPTPPRTCGVRVVGGQPRTATAGTVVEARGAEVFVGDRLEAGNRQGRERLAAYVTRPSLSRTSVRLVSEACVELTLREPAPDGAVAVQLSKPEFEARVRALAEGGVSRRLILHGALAPGSRVRVRGGATQLALWHDTSPTRPKRTRTSVADRCRCGGRLEVVAAEPLERGLAAP